MEMTTGAKRFKTFLALCAMTLISAYGCANTDTAKTELATPAFTGVTQNEDGSVTATWSGVDGAAGYNLYYGQTAGVSDSNNEGAVGTTLTTATIEGIGAVATDAAALTTPYTYYFSVMAHDGNGLESSLSAEFTAEINVDDGASADTGGDTAGDDTGGDTTGDTGGVVLGSGLCMPDHDWVEVDPATPIWSYESCGAEETKIIQQTTVGDDGTVLGGTAVNRGMLSFTQTNSLNGYYSSTDVFTIFMRTFGNNNGEVNWHWHSYWTGGTNLQSRLTAQRFDGTCSDFCEEKAITNSLQFTSTDQVFEWTCTWDTFASDQWVGCKVNEENNPVLLDEWTRLRGHLNALNYLGVGKYAYMPGGYPTATMTIYNLRLTIFQ